MLPGDGSPGIRGALFVERRRRQVPHAERRERARQRAVAGAERLLDGARREQVGIAGTVRGQLPHAADDRRVRAVHAVALRQEPPEDPRAVLVHPSAAVDRHPRVHERARTEPAAVGVDVVRDPVLHPHRGALGQPRVLARVVRELHGVEELVRRGRAQTAGTSARTELRDREVVVDDHVRGVVAVLIAVIVGVWVVGRHVPAQAERAHIRQVHVQLVVRTVVGRASVGLRRAEPHAHDLDPPCRLERMERRVDLIGNPVAVAVGRGRRVGRRVHPVHAQMRSAQVLARATCSRDPADPRSRRWDEAPPVTRACAQRRRTATGRRPRPTPRGIPGVRRPREASTARISSAATACRCPTGPWNERWDIPLPGRGAPGRGQGGPGVTAAIVGRGSGLRQSAGRPALRRTTQTGRRGLNAGLGTGLRAARRPG